MMQNCILGCMKVTIRLNNALHREAKRYALEHGITFTAVVQEALEEKLANTPKPFKLITFYGKLQPGVNLDNNAELLDLMEEGLDITSRR